MRVSRDPFAREELHRDTLYSAQDSRVNFGCSWCGQVKQRRGIRFLFWYNVQRDAQSGRRHSDDKLFCSVDCRRSYFGGGR